MLAQLGRQRLYGRNRNVSRFFELIQKIQVIVLKLIARDFHKTPVPFRFENYNGFSEKKQGQ